MENATETTYEELLLLDLAAYRLPLLPIGGVDYNALHRHGEIITRHYHQSPGTIAKAARVNTDIIQAVLVYRGLPTLGELRKLRPHDEEPVSDELVNTLDMLDELEREMPDIYALL